MATLSTNTVLDHTGDAPFRTWVAEVIAGLTTVGITQTGDTGQINTVTVNRPAVNTFAGYAVFRFNDTAHATNPIFFRIDFGTGSVATNPRMAITVGRGSNGSGTINGLLLTQVAVNASASGPNSTVVNYPTRWCYSSTQGFLGFVWKIGGLTGTQAHGGFVIYRSTDANGDATTDSTHLITNQSNSVNGSSSSGTGTQVISHLNTAVYTALTTPERWNSKYPFGVTTSLFASNNQTIPCYQYTPVLGITNQLTVCLTAEIGLNSTVTMTLVGSTPHTYLNVGTAFGQTSTWGDGLSATNHSLLMLWE